MKSILLIVFFVVYNLTAAFSQYNAGGTQFYIGPKASVNAARYSPGKNLPNVPSAYKNKVGYDFGLLYKFKVNDYISLHGEFNYARKTRSVKDSVKITSFKNKHIDAPILFELSFPAKNKYIGKFEYYFNIGPQLSYWLSGEGESTLTGNNDGVSSTYEVSFSDDASSAMSSAELNRMQYGFILGAGLTLPSVGDNFFVVEMRYFFCQTYLGGKYTNTINNMMYEDDLRGNYNVLSLSLAYTFGLNFKPNTQKNSGTKVKTVVK